ncbi:hypothetical protein ACFOD4_09830 [Pseudoroseomonas globiformis]|uniref:Uncharacterized protein n=1 Tax=Teichococcus globiformis TaxID=2307229 RepID=A0ABV7G2V2_9PROT
MAAAPRKFLTTAKFAMEVDGDLRALLSAREWSDGTIFVDLKPGEFMRPTLYHDWEIEKPIKAQKYSIHPTNKSKIKINVIKLTTTLQDGTELTQANYTKGIKSNSSFSVLYTKRSPDIRDKPYDIDDARDYIRIGKYNPHNSTLIYSVVASRKGTELRANPARDIFNVYNHTIGHFNIAICWTVASLKSDVTGTIFHTITFKEGPHPITGEIEAPLFSPALEARPTIKYLKQIRLQILAKHFHDMVMKKFLNENEASQIFREVTFDLVGL